MKNKKRKKNEPILFLLSQFLIYQVIYKTNIIISFFKIFFFFIIFFPVRFTKTHTHLVLENLKSSFIYEKMYFTRIRTIEKKKWNKNVLFSLKLCLLLLFILQDKNKHTKKKTEKCKIQNLHYEKGRGTFIFNTNKRRKYIALHTISAVKFTRISMC